MLDKTENTLKKGFDQITQALDLGSVTHCKPLTGGRLHKVWYLETTKNAYVIKILNPDKIKTLGYEKYEQFETIAASFQAKNINSVPALSSKPQIFPMSEQYYLIYPYQPGAVIEGSQMNQAKASNIGCLLGQMHQASLDIEIPVKPHCYADLNKLEEAIHDEKGLNYSVQEREALKAIHLQCEIACNTHQTSKAVISHGDMDLANIIWEQDMPWLIDWEYAGKFDALYDLINSALYASETSPGNFNIALFQAVINGYTSQLNLPANCSTSAISEALYLAQAGWMRWINYNFSREFAGNEEQQQLARGQIEKWSKTVLAVHENHGNFVESVISQVKQQTQDEKQSVTSMIQTGWWSNSTNLKQESSINSSSLSPETLI